MVRKLRDIFLCFPIFGCSLFVAHPGELLLWNSHKSSKHPKKRSSTVTVMVFPLGSVRRLRRWIVGTCRRELQVANGAWEMLQGKPWASWGRFFLNFMLAFVWLEEIFATQNTRGRKECNNLWVFFFEFSGQSVWSGNVVTPCLFALLHPQKFGCDWWWRQQKKPNGRPVDASASAFSMALATRERIVSSATWNTKNPSWSWTRCEKNSVNFFGAFFNCFEGYTKSREIFSLS